MDISFGGAHFNPLHGVISPVVEMRKPEFNPRRQFALDHPADGRPSGAGRHPQAVLCSMYYNGLWTVSKRTRQMEASPRRSSLQSVALPTEGAQCQSATKVVIDSETWS